jgi:Domain of unknown function (DU1801)
MAKKTTKKKTTKKAAKKKTTKTVSKKVAKKSTKKKTTKKASANKTAANSKSVDAFLKKAPAKYGDDCQKLIEIMSSITKEDPQMWGPSIVGFGSYHYVYESGREGDMCLTGFSPRAGALSLYVLSGFEDKPELMDTLGKFKTGKGCLYIKSLDDVHIPTLKKLIRHSVSTIKKRYPS